MFASPSGPTRGVRSCRQLPRQLDRATLAPGFDTLRTGHWCVYGRASARRRVRALAALLWWVAAVLTPAAAFAQRRQLHWDSLDVAAHLAADGTLRITETHAMVFSGDWNGGERQFDIRPRQRMAFDTIRRVTAGGLIDLREDSSLDGIDEYAWTGTYMLRWRSRLPSAPPYANTPLRYELRYALSNVLLKDGDQYRLDHDFAFPDRPGDIARFTLRLTLDPAWQPLSVVPPDYTVAPIPAGRSFLVTLPMRFSGAGIPAAIDVSRPPHVVAGVAVVLGVTIVALLWFFVRERSYGRFAPLETQIDETWLQQHLLKYPAEVVAAAWDDTVGPPEVVTLIARLVADGKLQSSVGEGTSPTMTLRLLVDRSTLEGYERTFVDKLFFDDRTETSTKGVREHYRRTGFNPAAVIRKELEEAVGRVLPAAPPPRRFWIVSVALFVTGLGLIGFEWFGGAPAAFALTIPILILAVIGWIAGFSFRTYLAWSWRAALWCLTPAVVIALGAAAYLWFYTSGADADFPPATIYGIVALALGCILSAINALKTRQHRDALAFRKALASARAFFEDELGEDEPALRDEWYPWVLAFELGKQADAWSVTPASQRSSSTRRRPTTRDVRDTRPSSSPAEARWTGFGGGRSGGAGASGSWEAAASGIAASVSSPSSSGSGRHSSSGSSGGWSGSSGGSSRSSGGSSSRGSSGGGGGGGW
jgi:hypothetical protein